MRYARFTATLAMLLLAAACSTPTTNRPMVSAEEIEAEQAMQQNAAISNPFPPIVEPVRATAAMKHRLQAVAGRVNPQASKLCYELTGASHEKKGCTFSLGIKGERGVNAYADGNEVVITAPMMLFAQNDTHLAFVLAHELAHNIMEHPQGQTGNVILGVLLGTAVDVAAGTGSSTFGRLGGDIALHSYSPSFEAEADYIGLYILARAGYPIEQAPNFWRAMAQYEPEGIYARGTHPTTAERFVAMNKTIAEIRAKQRTRQPLLPNIRREG